MNLEEATRKHLESVADTIMGRPVTVAMLDAAFERVRPVEHWKNPLDRVVDVADDFDREVISRAVVWFTGSVPTFTPVPGGALPGCRYRVRAAGYYAAIGA